MSNVDDHKHGRESTTRRSEGGALIQTEMELSLSTNSQVSPLYTYGKLSVPSMSQPTLAAIDQLAGKKWSDDLKTEK